ncbi:nucleotidyltransferase family protein [Mesorhizobium sp. VNQ89]|uniref:nucleotidyltransferase family protein n=1 Tax=Mesorhizobium quangtriensis TaxID=3157709 RepID=UPI0032B80122
MKIGRTEAWLARLSDPRGANERFRPSPFDASERGQMERLVGLAARHNVRPAFARNLMRQLKDAPLDFLAGDTRVVAATSAWLSDHANDLRIGDFARASLLADVAGTIREKIAAAALPAVIVKGVDFAEVAYGGLYLRTFSDVDLLVRPDAAEALGDVLRDLGFTEHVPSGKRVDYTERAWTRADQHGTTLVEVHTDVVHAPELRAAQSLTYDLYADPALGGVTHAARLVLAALHGSTSHLFGRLQYVVDGLMVARLGPDPEELVVRAKRSGATLPLVTMLRLAWEIYGCEISADLLGRLGPLRWGGLESRLIRASMVLAAKGEGRWMLLPQRYLYRRLLHTTF